MVLLQDSFIGSFDGTVLDAASRLLERNGYDVVMSRVWANGKAEHVLGMTERFVAIARRAQAERKRLAALRVPLVTLDAATGLLFEEEYQEFATNGDMPPVLAIEDFLIGEIEAGRIAPGPTKPGAKLTVMLHCTERTARPKSAGRWYRVLAHFGLEAEIPAAGCCGMAGMFGHEAEHAALSRRIFDLGWLPRLTAASLGDIAATGFSCRCQTKRFAGRRPPHPVDAILAHLERGSA